MATAPLRRRIIVPSDTGLADAYIDDPDGLIWMATWSSLDAAKAANPGARVLPAIWDAPIIDPADPSTHYSWDDEAGRFENDSASQWP